MGAVVLDASVVIGFLNLEDALHDRAVQMIALLLTDAEELLMPATGYAEILVHAIREERSEHIDHFVEDTGLHIVPVGRGLARRTAELRARHAGLRLPDALVLATAVENDARLITLDLRLQRLFDELRSNA